MVQSRPADVPFTYEDYCYIPDDGRRHEIVEGDLYVTPAPSTTHQTVSRRLQYKLMQQLEEAGRAFVFNAPVDVILSNTTVVQPDLVIVDSGRKEIITERGVEGPPDVVVEIVSPASRGNDLHLKRAAYARFGIGEYWIVEPDLGRVEVYRLGQSGYELQQRYDRASTVRSLAFDAVAIALEPVFRPL